MGNELKAIVEFHLRMIVFSPVIPRAYSSSFSVATTINDERESSPAPVLSCHRTVQYVWDIFVKGQIRSLSNRVKKLLTITLKSLIIGVE